MFGLMDDEVAALFPLPGKHRINDACEHDRHGAGLGKRDGTIFRRLGNLKRSKKSRHGKIRTPKQFINALYACTKFYGKDDGDG
jgi:hypothetical protein